MRPRWGIRARVWIAWAFLAAGLSGMAAGHSQPPTQLSTTLVKRAQEEYDRVQNLVEQGTLPRARLDEAQAKLQDAQDEEILMETLFGQPRAEDMTSADTDRMVTAARSRFDRQARTVEGQKKLLEAGVIAPVEMEGVQNELESRRQVLQLAENRQQLVQQLREMAETEQRFEHNAQDLRNVMLRYEGSRAFSLSELPVISRQFESRFHTQLPVSALGQTKTHETMGLDHRDRVDVALNPDQPEGVWLRKYLERLRIPYLAFRAAVAGAATAPHIHIGMGSARLRLADRFGSD